MKIPRILICLLIVGSWLSIANAAIINLDLTGNAGTGLLIGNENPAVLSGGRGGEIGAGCFFDNVSLALTINVGWGSGNGFTDLTGTASAGHIHGPTANGAPTSFGQNASVLFNFGAAPFTFNTSATNGTVTGTMTLTSGQAAELLAGRYYVNIHTATNPGGEIRGYLVVPEPSSVALLLAGLSGAMGVAWFRRSRPRS